MKSKGSPVATKKHRARPKTPLAPDAGAAVAIPAPEPAPFLGFLVAIGASAGGLDALERLFDALAADTGAAFVVVQHLSPDHKSMMDNLLARHTAMPVTVAEHQMPLQPNHVFLIPPGKTMTLMGDRLQLAPKPDHGLSLPIDVFFHSLADQWHDKGVAVVLSGTGSDGARGLAAVNAGGGFVYVQDPLTAKFDGMPRSAIATGLVDVVAPAAELARKLAEHILAPKSDTARLLAADLLPTLAKPLDGILERLVASSGIDFREYKPATVLRRIERRMQVLHCRSLADYLERLSSSLDEQQLLRRELLIPVTRFFRDSEVWDTLGADVIDELVKNHDPIEPIRVWVACCATGEEAYSMAISFAESFVRLKRSHALKIFATDVEQQYLDHASAGLYPETIAAEVSMQRLERYFVRKDGGYAIRQELRQSVIFARHNLVADPPFTRMDLVSCRNALIYFQPVAQERALRRLQYALLSGGCLLLGPSESLGVLQRDFSVLHGRHKVYRLMRKERLSVSLQSEGRHRRIAPHSAVGGVAAGLEAEVVPAPVQAGHQRLASEYLPPSLLVGEGRALLHVYGDARDMLRIGAGNATLDVLKLLPRELALSAGLLLQAASDGQVQRSGVLTIGSGDTLRRLRMVARPLGEGDAGTKAVAGVLPSAHSLLTLLSFEPVAEPAVEPAVPASSPAGTAGTAEPGMDPMRLIERLERELSATHDSLQATIEELETANEELQATNEELMASNEELQSTNEELQSVNEELYTVNSEFQEKVDILNAVNADLENVSKAAAIPTVFVDDELMLTRFTPQAAQLFKVRETDVGRSLEDFAHTLEYPELFADLRRALKDGAVTEREVRSRDGRWWMARIQPYADRAHATLRAVMTCFDISSVKDSQRLQAVIDSLPDHLAVVDAQGTISQVNRAWREFSQANGDVGLNATGPGTDYLRVCAESARGDEDARRAHDGLRAVLDGSSSGFRLQYPCHSPTEQRWFLMHAAPVKHPSGGAVVSHIDVTGWVRDQPGSEEAAE